MSGPFDLTGRRAIVTGANTGIGQGIALALAQAGAEVVAVGRSSMAETEAAIAAVSGTCVPYAADLSGMAAVDALVPDVWERLGPIDILVNNAGIIRRGDAVDFAESDWDDVMDVNLKTVFMLSQALARRAFAAERPAKIINIASMLSFQGGIRIVSYTAAKSGLAGLTRILAHEWAGRGINVNAIAPGAFASEMMDGMLSRMGDITKGFPRQRLGDPAQLDSALLFLVSPASDAVTGTVIRVDDGQGGR